MIKAEFLNVNEMRMGSPYMVAEKVNVIGWDGHLNEWEYQNIFHYDQKYRIGVLIKWDVDNNGNPGFKPIVIHEGTNKLTEIPRIEGCCDKIFTENNKIYFEVFKYPNRETLFLNIPEKIT